MWKYIENKRTGVEVTSNIYGLLLVNEDSYYVDLFTKLVTRLSKKDSRGPVNLSKYSTCNSFKCALNKIFTNNTEQLDMGIMYAYALSKYGVNGSQIANHTSKSYTVDEFQSVLYALSAIPETMLPLYNNKRMSRVDESGMNRTGSKNLANASIELYDYWSTFNFYSRAYAFFHELGHNLGSSKKAIYRKEWASISGWLKKPKSVIYKRDDTKNLQISKYAQVSIGEDFAESISAYRFSPTELKALSIEKYNYIRWGIFSGIEFTDDRDCNNENSLIEFSNFIEKTPTENITQLTTSSLGHCQDKLFGDVFGSTNVGQDCVKQQIMTTLVESTNNLESGLKIFYENNLKEITTFKFRNFEFNLVLQDYKNVLKLKLLDFESQIFKYYTPRLFNVNKPRCQSIFGYGYTRQNLSSFSEQNNISLDSMTKLTSSLVKYCEENPQNLKDSKSSFLKNFLQI
jgi:hypothetical protein